MNSGHPCFALPKSFLKSPVIQIDHMVSQIFSLLLKKWKPNVFCFAPDALMGPSENIRACLCGRPSVLQLFNTRCEAYYWTNNWDFIQFRCSICSGSTSAWHLKCGISQPREIENYNIFLPRLSLSLIALMNTRSANVLASSHLYKMWGCKNVKQRVNFGECVAACI